MASQGRTRGPEDENAFVELPRKMNHVGGSGPSIDASETNGVVWMVAEVPGVAESDIDIRLEGDILTISVDKQNRNAGKRVFFSERSYGRFERSIQLPFAPDPETVDATIGHGLLTISFPRGAASILKRAAGDCGELVTFKDCRLVCAGVKYALSLTLRDYALAMP